MTHEGDGDPQEAEGRRGCPDAPASPSDPDRRDTALERHRRQLSELYGREVTSAEAALHAQRLARLLRALAPPKKDPTG